MLSENLLFAEERVAVRTDRAKLVRWVNGKEEAYDLVRDPAELRDLAGVSAFVEPLQAKLAALEPATVPRAAATRPPGGASGRRHEVKPIRAHECSAT